jgi:hypothetical protein
MTQGKQSIRYDKRTRLLVDIKISSRPVVFQLITEIRYNVRDKGLQRSTKTASGSYKVQTKLKLLP